MLGICFYDLGGKNGGAFFAGEDLDALGGGVRALVELAGKILDGEGRFVCGEVQGGKGVVHLRLGQDVGQGFVEFRSGEAVDVA